MPPIKAQSLSCISGAITLRLSLVEKTQWNKDEQNV
jgi:hypothetical protein